MRESIIGEESERPRIRGHPRAATFEEKLA